MTEPNGMIELPTIASLNDVIHAFWNGQISEVHSGPLDFKFHQLPLARIKKVMKADEDVKNMMISSEAPMIFSKACEIFILELTIRAWFHTEDNKRRTLQKSDVAAALSKADMYDFLIDIVPRESSSPNNQKDASFTYMNASSFLTGLSQQDQQALFNMSTLNQANLSAQPQQPQQPQQQIPTYRMMQQIVDATSLGNNPNMPSSATLSPNHHRHPSSSNRNIGFNGVPNGNLHEAYYPPPPGQ